MTTSKTIEEKNKDFPSERKINLNIDDNSLEESYFINKLD